MIKYNEEMNGWDLGEATKEETERLLEYGMEYLSMLMGANLYKKIVSALDQPETSVPASNLN